VADSEVVLTREAEADLEGITEFIERHDSRQRADHVYDRIKEAILKLESFPRRGRFVPELREVGLKEYREVLFKPHRVLYFVSGKRVFVHCVFDGRRNVHDVLSQRFLR
jgi:toxin ParE1/3/4